jgi:serine/threonine-protein kinase
MRPVVWFVVIAVAGVAAGYGGVRLLTPRYPVPTVTAAMAASPSRAQLPHAFRLTVHHLRKDRTKPGDVLGQRPAPGAREASGTIVVVDVSDGQTLAPVPPVVNQAEAAATAQLKEAGFVVGTITRAFHDTLAKGTVISSTPPPGFSLVKGETVALTVSDGPHPVTLADFHGQPFSQVQTQLQQLGFTVARAQQNDDTVPAGNVISTAPGPGDVAPGSTITVTVSLGPQIVTVPNVSGESVSQATQDLKNAGLQVGNVYGPKGGSVFSTRPEAGQQVAHGSTVDLYIDR